MDQMTSALGRRDHLLELVCQPAEVVGQLRVPDDIEFVGVDSGIRHAVSGADYGTVRAAAFMGYRMITAAAGVEARPLSPGRVAIDDALFKGYLANVPAADWRGRYRAEVPEQLLGGEFLARFARNHRRDHDDRSGAQLSRAGRDRARDRGAPARPRVSRVARRQAAAWTNRPACGWASSCTRRTRATRPAGSAPTGPTSWWRWCARRGPASGSTARRSRAAAAAARSRSWPSAAGERNGNVTATWARGQIAERYGRESGHGSAVYVGSSDGSRAFGVRTLRCSGRD